MKKVLFLIPTLAQGGGERVVSELSLHFPKDIETVIVLFEQRVSYPFQGRLLDLGTRVSANFFTRSFSFFLRLFRFKRVLYKEAPDWVVSVGSSANVINLLVGRNPVVRVDLPVSKSSRGFWGFLYKVFVRLLFHRALRIVAVSRLIALDLAENFGVAKEKIQVIFNPVDSAKIQKMSEQRLPKEEERIFQHPVVVTMGRLTYQKGQWRLLRAFKKVKQKVPDAKLVILGEGELQGFLSKLAEDLQLADDVHFLGWQQNPFSFLSRSSLFVLPSLWEGLPDVLLEAMSCALPVVSSDCVSGPREILDPRGKLEKKTKGVETAEYGILVPAYHENFSKTLELSKEEELLAEAMLLVLKNPALAKTLRGKSKERSRDFDMKRILREWDFLRS